MSEFKIMYLNRDKTPTPKGESHPRVKFMKWQHMGTINAPLASDAVDSFLQTDFEEMKKGIYKLSLTNIIIDNTRGW